jgi:energy-converting hydrogenase Eha subunit F
VRVYLLNSSRCVTELDSYSYTVDNVNNSVTVNINLGRPLNAGETILVYLKFKPAPGLVGSYWNDLNDKWFDNTAYVETNIGSQSVGASIELVKK